MFKISKSWVFHSTHVGMVQTPENFMAKIDGYLWFYHIKNP
jgi:hypothetical protein